MVAPRIGTSSTSCVGCQMGFFAEVGPVQIFVSSHLIPDDFDYSALDDPCFVSEDEEVRNYDKEFLCRSNEQRSLSLVLPLDCALLFTESNLHANV